MKDQEIKLEDVFNDEKRQGVKDLIDKHKQETLEEASWKYNPLKKLDGEFLRHAFKEGAKWQQERMYSEEDMRQAFNNGAWRWRMHSKVDIFKEWLKTLKKK